MPSTPVGVSAGRVASFRVVNPSVSAVHAVLCAWFDSRQLYSRVRAFAGPDASLCQSAASPQQNLTELLATNATNGLNCGFTAQPTQLSTTNAQLISFASSRSGVRFPLAPAGFGRSRHIPSARELSPSAERPQYFGLLRPDDPLRPSSSSTKDRHRCRASSTLWRGQASAEPPSDWRAH